MPPTPAPIGDRDVTGECSATQLLQVRQHALDLANSRLPVNAQVESDASRRLRVTADAAAYVNFILAGKISGT